MTDACDADRYAHLELELACPHCRSRGLIPWEHLDRLLLCHGCSAVFRVEPTGLVELDEPQKESILIQVRSNSSQWREEKIVLQRQPTLHERLCAAALEFVTNRWTLRLVPCVLVGLIVAAVVLSREPPPPPEFILPTALEERATLLGTAVARRDVNLLVRMTDPSQHRAARIWLAHEKQLPQVVTADEDEISSELISAAKTTPEGDHVNAQVRVRVPPDGKEFVLKQVWQRQNDVWYFQPTKIRAASAARPWRADDGRAFRGKN